MKKALFLVGPTSSGKTELAFTIAPKISGKIVSADSRQVYKDLDIISGKDVPKGSVFKSLFVENNFNIGYYTVNGVEIYGLDIVDPRDKFSVFDYVNLIVPLIEEISSKGSTPIITGGTGFYIKALIDGIETLDVKSDEKLRKELSSLSVEELKQLLKKEDKLRFEKMNNSDKNNPRRLIRAIEIVRSGGKKKLSRKLKDYELLIIGMKVNKEEIKKRIKTRVEKRIAEGAFGEAEKLFENYPRLCEQVRTGIGYRQIFDYLQGRVTKAEAVVDWEKAELNLIKRQMTWFKKDKRIKWVDANDKEKICDVILSWYNEGKQ